MKKAKSIAKLKKDLDKVFNKFIRERDSHYGYFTCISCREVKSVSFMHAGHFYAGTFTYTRWHEKNVNGQCSACNTFKHGNLLEYRNGMINKYGYGVLEELENTHRKPVKLDRFELEGLIEHYKKLTK